MAEIFMGQRLLHLMPVEIELWKKFLPRVLDQFEQFLYDVHLGEGVELDPSWPPEIARAATTLTQKRVDAIGLRPGEVWLFEVKPDAGLSALGQLLGYRSLWIRQRGPTPIPRLAIVTDRVNRDERYLFESNGIVIYEV